jgi:hypothetical protein
VIGFSVYTWNAAPFLDAIAHMRASCPESLIVVGGPHVQKAEHYLGDDPVDVVVLGEGEATFCELLDAEGCDDFERIAGVAFLRSGELVRTPARERRVELDALPTALDVIALRDPSGKPRYKTVAYETSRGCPFRCAFCEWGTGAIGTKMYQFSLARIERDFERLIEGGIEDIWLCDSNFGALREDLDKAKIIVELRKRTGRPYTLATSWSKSHNARVQEIVLLLKEHGLLMHYNLALQTLTPLALKLSNRKNMQMNRYQPIAKAMAEQGVTIATELIWGLPGTEFYERREEYAIETIPVAGYGKAKGEYVVGCHTFDRDEGIEGYFLITAHIVLIRGYVMPLTTRYLALEGSVPVSALLRAVLRGLVEEFARDVPGLDPERRMDVYESRAELYLAMLSRLPDCFAVIRRVVDGWLGEHAADPALSARVARVLELDHAFCPRVGRAHDFSAAFAFPAARVRATLERMELPAPEAFEGGADRLAIHHPAHVGEVLKDPDGGSWMRGQLRSEAAAAEPEAPVAAE